MRFIERYTRVSFRVFIPAIVALSLTTSFSARASEIVYSDLGAQPLSSGGPDILGAGAIPGAPFQAIAYTFTPLANFTLTSIEVAMTWISGVNAIVLDLDRSGVGGLPGQTLERWTVTSLPSYNPNGSTTQVLSYSDVQLIAGQSYWLAAYPGNASTAVFWNNNTSGATGDGLANLGSGWFDLPGLPGGFKVSGIPITVPEIDPNSIVSALALVSGGLLVLRGSRRKAL